MPGREHRDESQERGDQGAQISQCQPSPGQCAIESASARVRVLDL